MSSAPQNIPPEELEQAKVVLQQIMQWVIGPLVEQSKAICERLDTVSDNLATVGQAITRAVDAFERRRPTQPTAQPTTTEPPSEGTGG